MSKVKALYHIVFCTKQRQMTINDKFAEDVYRFIWKKISDQKCKLVRIGGIQNHIHMLVELHPSEALATLMKEVKGGTSAWLNKNPNFPLFNGWAAEYYACTISPEVKDNVIEYIKSQKTHHLGTPFDQEIQHMCVIADIEYHDKDLQ